MIFKTGSALHADTYAAFRHDNDTIIVPVNDTLYALPSYEWLVKFIVGWKQYLFDIGYEYKVESSDCDDYSAIFRGEVLKANRRSHYRAGVPVMELSTKLTANALGVNANNNVRHRSIGIWVEKNKQAAFYVVEPQNGRFCLASKYPCILWYPYF